MQMVDEIPGVSLVSGVIDAVHDVHRILRGDMITGQYR